MFVIREEARKGETERGQWGENGVIEQEEVTQTGIHRENTVANTGRGRSFKKGDGTGLLLMCLLNLCAAHYNKPLPVSEGGVTFVLKQVTRASNTVSCANTALSPTAQRLFLWIYPTLSSLQ